MKTVYIIDGPRYPYDKIIAFENKADAEAIAEKLHGDEYPDHVIALPLISDQAIRYGITLTGGENGN